MRLFVALTMATATAVLALAAAEDSEQMIQGGGLYYQHTGFSNREDLDQHGLNKRDLDQHGLNKREVLDQHGLNNRQFPGFTFSPTTSSKPGPGGGLLTFRKRPSDCSDLLMSGVTESGPYLIYPFTCTCREPVLVWCDMETDGGGWTVFLNRHAETNPMRLDMDFNRTWQEYKQGFGHPTGEHWLGNEVIYVLTHARAYTLRLDMTLTSGAKEYATCQTIRVSNEAGNYRMNCRGSRYGTSNSYYCFSYMYYPFSTVDRDNEYYSGNCAAMQGGGWWYYNCKYFNPTSALVNDTLQITCRSNQVMEVSQIQLKIRPQLCDEKVKVIQTKNNQCGCNNPPAV